MKVQKYFSKVFVLFCVATLLSCASYKVRYSSEYIHREAASNEEPLLHSLYLIGDAGNAPRDSSTHVFKYLTSLLNEEDSNSTIVWLGDNIYPVGLAPEGHADHALGKHRLLKQLECHDNYMGNVFFIPGNHDWYEFGAEGVRRQEAVIEEYLSSRSFSTSNPQENYFVPDSACPGFVIHPLTDNSILVLTDSQWFLSDEAISGSNCDITSREEYLEELSRILESNSEKQIIFCQHHPPITYGSHGSRFAFKDYFFPFSQINKAIILPLPFTGLLVNQVRGYLTMQDNKHVAYRALHKQIESSLKNTTAPIIASGHEHSLQYNVKDNIRYIVSGAGSKNNPVGKGKYQRFAIGEKGFVLIKIFEGQQHIQYFVPHKTGTDADILFEEIIKL